MISITKKQILFIACVVSVCTIGIFLANNQLDIFHDFRKFLPKQFQGTILQKPVEIEIVNNNPSITLGLINKRKVYLIQEKIEKLFTARNISRITLDVTANPEQKLTFAWSNNKKYAGFTSNFSGNTLIISLYINPQLLKQAGWSENDISREAEFIFIQALLDAERQAFPISGNEEGAKGVENILAFQADKTERLAREVSEQEKLNLFSVAIK